MENKGEFRAQHARLHFIGIGGVGMYSLARLAMNEGYRISGSDLTSSTYTENLSSLGAEIFYTHAKEHIDGAEAVVYSHAIAEDNPELRAAMMSGVGIYSRAELLGLFMKSFECRIGISGSHGKSTTSAMVYHILSHLGKAPTAAIGAPVLSGMPFAQGSTDLLVYEACEYKDSFLKLFPSVVAITNIELDHTDYFSDINDIKHSFLMCINRAEACAVINLDDENSSSLIPLINAPTVTYGFSDNAEIRARISSFCENGIKYTLFKNNSYCGEYFLPTLATFNITNALCAISAVYAACGASVGECAAALESFSGIARRMELVGRVDGRDIIYDYAHHPTEIRAVIDALKLKYERLTVIFTPHTYTRTRDMWDDFVSALTLADSLIITDIYPAREEPIDGICSERLAAAVGQSALYAPDTDAASIALSFDSSAIAVMGAGNNERVVSALLKKFP